MSGNPCAVPEAEMAARLYYQRYNSDIQHSSTRLWHGLDFQPPHVQRSDDCAYTPRNYNPVPEAHRVPNQANGFGPVFGIAELPRPSPSAADAAAADAAAAAASKYFASCGTAPMSMSKHVCGDANAPGPQ
jgi:hypothetical protein